MPAAYTKRLALEAVNARAIDPSRPGFEGTKSADNPGQGVHFLNIYKRYRVLLSTRFIV